ncbi:MAG: hypothetical protein ACYCY2_03575 [Acidithiobacillus ferriphilus]|uniref:hypothetical protein n=1 Tax=Acidithiobacillus ferriphilus TaxID=1689834 RepID=UPI001C064C46|nr:hypothetical protein [Acidithiobacillus ferriphilus]MBU2827593.1 hypothetical protein [Acidithiobacillus ferriphilus]
MSTDAEPFDCWAPFKTVNALSPDIPHKGQPSMEKLDDERPPLERHAEQVRRFALDVIRREPSAPETAEAIEQVTSLRAWIDEHWEGPEKTGPDFYQELESRAYNAGLLSLWWGLTGDMAELRAFLQFMRDWQDKAGAQSVEAMTRADRRESAEWTVVAQAIGNMEYQATTLKSPRLAEAAKVMRAMLTADRLRPEAPAKEARATGAKKAATARHAGTGELKNRILAECKKYQRGTQWKNPAAQKVAPVAFRWNTEAGKPFSWLDVAAAEKKVRRWLSDL